MHTNKFNFRNYILSSKAPSLGRINDSKKIEQHFEMSNHCLGLALIMSFNAIGTTFLISITVENTNIAYWLCIQLVFAMLLFSHTIRNQFREPPAHVSGRFLKKSETMGLVFGIAWGSAPFFLTNDPIMAAIVCGLITPPMLAGLAALLPSNPRVVMRYVLGATLGIVGFGLTEMSPYPSVVAVMEIIFVTALYIGVRRTFSTQMSHAEAAANAEDARAMLVNSLEASGQGFAVISDDGKIIYQNEVYKKIVSIESHNTNAHHSDIVRQNNFVWRRRIKTLPNLGRVVIYEDQTQSEMHKRTLERALDEAEAANKSKTQFLESMARDILSPLSTIIACSSVMDASSDIEVDESMIANYSNIILTSARNLKEDLNAIFEYTAMDLDVELEDSVSLSVADVVETTLKQLNPSQNKDAPNVSLRLDPDIRCVFESETGAMRMVRILLSQALRAPNATEVTVKLSRVDDANFALIVRDNGAPYDENFISNGSDISAETDRVYKTNVRTPSTLSFPIAKKVAAACGGRIIFASSTPKNTSVVFTAPMAVQIKDDVEANDQQVA
jgi:signal transduction histidine kinase